MQQEALSPHNFAKFCGLEDSAVFVGFLLFFGEASKMGTLENGAGGRTRQRTLHTYLYILTYFLTDIDKNARAHFHQYG